MIHGIVFYVIGGILLNIPCCLGNDHFDNSWKLAVGIRTLNLGRPKLAKPDWSGTKAERPGSDKAMATSGKEVNLTRYAGASDTYIELSRVPARLAITSIPTEESVNAMVVEISRQPSKALFISESIQTRFRGPMPSSRTCQDWTHSFKVIGDIRLTHLRSFKFSYLSK